MILYCLVSNATINLVGGKKNFLTILLQGGDDVTIITMIFYWI